MRTGRSPGRLARALVVATALVAAFTPPSSAAAGSPSNVNLVNPFIGTSGASDSEYGGMIPSTAPPFAMTRWSPMTRQNYVSRTPYRYDETKISGFIGTHQPAI
ncbi:hypothetical protein [Streptomyces sp. NPDC056160]|uniref:hypothetical protein n=1 Tax=Streptomyces sp. NPDC056160 TaxID=3345731 RepID=UPI0035DE85A2